MKKFFYIIFFNLMLIIKSLLFSGLGYSETLIKSHGISSFGNLKYSKDFFSFRIRKSKRTKKWRDFYMGFWNF